MRKSLLVSSVLASGALLCSLGANAIPIHVGLLSASGDNTWTSSEIGDPHGYVSLSGWENDNGTWSQATMIRNPDVPGLGIQCNSPLGPDCTSDQIGSTPEQVIDMDISQITDWTALLITIDSVKGMNTGYLYGATCTPGGDCEPKPILPPLDRCITTVKGSCTFSIYSANLGDITNIWITPVDFSQRVPDPIVLDGNLYVCAGAGSCALPASVPEPKALGMFGMGLLLIGAFLGLRRRRFGG